MGHDFTNTEQQFSHFTWCWNKNILNFKEEGILFNNGLNNSLYNYYLEFMLEVYYLSPEKKENDNISKDILKLWFNIFDYNREKTNSDIDMLVEIYNIFQTSLVIKI